MKIYIIEKSKKTNSEKTLSQFSIKLQNKIIKLAHDTIQWLKCVLHYLNMKMKEKSVEIIDLKFGSSLKWDWV